MWKKGLKTLVSLIIVITFIFAAVTARVMSMPRNINVTGQKANLSALNNINLKSNLIYKACSLDTGSIVTGLSNKSSKMNISIKLFGVIPVKNVTLNFIPEYKVIPGGQPIGVRIHTVGALVVGFADIDSVNGRKQSPAVLSGIEIGDCIIEINGSKIQANNDISKILNSNGNTKVNVKAVRKGENKIFEITPLQTKNKNEYKIGLWVRDSTAGVGTLTFYDPSSLRFGALGHPINDIDTGTLFEVRDGEIFNAKIVSIEQGLKGKPGELRGIFSDDDEIGILQKNTSSGIFGKLTGSVNKTIYSDPIPVARQSEIVEGPASILTSIDGTSVNEYSAYIEKITQQSKPNSKSMIIRITDSKLLEKTGGIVQGMSGSPIIQNGKIIGAVTHVFVNRPDMGYGIYIEWMLEELGFSI